MVTSSSVVVLVCRYTISFIYTCEYPPPFDCHFTLHWNLYIDYSRYSVYRMYNPNPIQSSFFCFYSSDALFFVSRFPLFCPLLLITRSNSHPNFQPCFWFFLPTKKVCSHSFLLNVDLCTQYYRQFEKASKHAIEPHCCLVSDNR